MENPFTEEFYRNCHAHATAVNGELIHLYINPLGLYDDEEKVAELRRDLEMWARDAYDFPSLYKDKKCRWFHPTDEQQKMLDDLIDGIDPDSGITIKF